MNKVLIIEDDQIVGSIYRRKFQAEGFDVALAADGEAGLQGVEEFQPDAVVLDLMLPRLNGVEVLRHLRSQPRTAHLPVIVLSNAYLSSLLKDAADAGANQCLIKANSSPKQVVEAIRKALAGGSLTTPRPPVETGAGTTADTPATPPTQPQKSSTPATPSESPSVGHPTPATPTEPGEDTVFETDLRQSFLQSAPETLGQLRNYLQAFIKSEGQSERLSTLFDLYRRVHSVTGNAAVAGQTGISQLCAALEALLKELYEKPRNINASTIRTTAQTIDFLGNLFTQANSNRATQPPAKPSILVVDDEAISRRAVVYALEKAHLQCTSVDNPTTALQRLAQEPYDLIFLDVDMPEVNGFEVCTRLRALEPNAHTPVIFVTGLTDFESRARSTLSGGNDLIAKPFLFMELALKAIAHILRGKLTPGAT